MPNTVTGSIPASPNVIPMLSPKVAARDRNRKKALAAIIPRLKLLRSRSDLYSVSSSVTVDHAVFGNLVCMFHETAEGIYFRIDEAGGGPPLMSGYYDNRGRNAQVYGPVHVMSWRRGWEDRLF